MAASSTSLLAADRQSKSDRDRRSAMTTALRSISAVARLAKTLVGAVILAACIVVLLVDVGTAQDDLVRIDGRVLWIAGATMIVAPYVAGDAPINVDLSRASQDEYMRLTMGDAVTVTGIVAEEGDRVIASSIRGRSIRGRS
jgi:hypothetical protein